MGEGTLFPLAASQNDGPAVSDDAQLIDEVLAGHLTACRRLVPKYRNRLYDTVV
jgi:hypothetical protein